MDIIVLIMNTKPPNHPDFISKQVISGKYLFSDLSHPADGPFSIISAGREECAANYQITRSGFSCYAIEYIASGRWELTTAEGTQELNRGSVFAYGPDTSYSMKPLDQHHLIKFFVDFKGIGSKEKIMAAQINFAEPIQLLNTRWVHDIFDQILDLAHSQRPFAKTAGTLLTELMIMRIKEDQLNVSGGKTHSHVTYMRCRRYILRNFARITRMDEVAQECHIDAPYLSRLFKRYSGESPYHFLTRLKMTHAADLLLSRDLTVKDVAGQLNYADPYHFSRVFKSHHGLSPKHFVEKAQRVR